MQYNTLGRTGLRVSRLAFGAMTFGTTRMAPGVANRIDQSAANDLVARALDAGINLFDTADVYAGGQSEELLGKALGSRRSDAIVSTKVGFPSGEGELHRGLSARHIIASAEG